MLHTHSAARRHRGTHTHLWELYRLVSFGRAGQLLKNGMRNIPMATALTLDALPDEMLQLVITAFDSRLINPFPTTEK